MNALSIRQPWAWLIVNGHKDIENRSWTTRFRGPFLVHAAQGMTREEYEDCRAFALNIRPEIEFPAFEALERGGIVGKADITGVVDADSNSSRWFFGPYGFVLKDAEPLPFRTMRGKLGFFEGGEDEGIKENPVYWYDHAFEPWASDANWWKPVEWNAAAAGAAVRPRVFCASLADWLDAEVPLEWLGDLLTLIAKTPNLDWLLLTKRPQLWMSRIAMVGQPYGKEGPQWTPGGKLAWDWLDGVVPQNVWVGTTVENQTRADERVPVLLGIPARVRFLSCEPLLGAVDISDYLCRSLENGPEGQFSDRRGIRGRLHWVIAGGESGSKARIPSSAWFRSLRDQCVAAGVPFHFKQWGEYGLDCSMMIKMGVKRAGRVLDGRTWDEFPSGKGGSL